MAQLHFYVPDKVAQEIRRKALQARLPLSRYLANLISREIETGWPEGYFEQVVGAWQGEPLIREPEGEIEQRPSL
jgi:hypothetical protein